MILDRLSRAEKYYALHPNFRQAFDYLKKNDVASLAPGTYPVIKDDIYLIISADEPGTERRKLETHQKFIDIQLALNGSFSLEWRDEDSCRDIFQEYHNEKDLMLYNDSPLFTVTLHSDLFAVLFPEDAHAPQRPVSTVKKAVVKVAL
ncbi:MAG: YhcH/YjgK/YiaL family protein [Bacteroidetes bacterium]|nr:YhcH/YjgK/YiaL family protein [Bacteroidota bacterium]